MTTQNDLLPGAGVTLTLEQRVLRMEDAFEIAQLRATYCHLLDDRRWNEFNDLFTEDATFDGLRRISGKAAIHEFFSVECPKIADQFWHFCSNGSIDVHGDTATGRISMEYFSVTSGISYVSFGHYDDVIVRTDGGWKFASRRITFYFYSPLKDGFLGVAPAAGGRRD